MAKKAQHKADPKPSRKAKATPHAPEAVIETAAVTVEMSAPEVSGANQETAQSQEDGTMKTLTFTLKSTDKSGRGRFHAEGYKGVLILSKTCFVGDVPESVELTGDFGEAGKTAERKSKKVLTPEQEAKKVERAAKRAARELKLDEQAAKLNAKLEKLNAKIAKKAAAAPATEAVEV
jgi:hypothetical protein